jgi:hypothetical protein
MVNIKLIDRGRLPKLAAAAALVAALILIASVGGLWNLRTVFSPWAFHLVVSALAVTVGLGVLG